MRIEVKQQGDWKKTSYFLDHVSKGSVSNSLLHKYGKMGVALLRDATPVDTGETASSWYYKIKNQNGYASITFYNSNVVNYVPIAIILQYGHATRNGGWVEGRDYINPALQITFDSMANEAWKEAMS